jgi:hypothetical protein
LRLGNDGSWQTIAFSKGYGWISYGMPGPEIWEEVDKGLLKLGGCLVEKDNPDTFCKDCEHEWVK